MAAVAVLAGCGISGRADRTEAAANADRPIVINYFFEPGCAECQEVSDKVMPKG
jgi:hypothetical protein